MDAQTDQQDESHPMVVAVDFVGSQRAHNPAYDRCDGFDYAKNSTYFECVNKTWTVKTGAFGNSGSKCIGGHGHTEHQ